MSILHTVNKSPFVNNSLASCLRLAAQGDGILLIEDGVYGGLNHTGFTPELEQALANFTLYVLQPDLAARGIVNQAHPKVQQIDYAGFVDLTVFYTNVQAWF
ncbi:MAG: sulfur relay protein TusB [Gammaproteobacteria bacterium]|jgi:tRNA 2-thiouridine synthesizing protein B|nr:sulfur relay protein TusB [Gammaproteobacteria bacterium]